jgi:hypothetical protein
MSHHIVAFFLVGFVITDLYVGAHGLQDDDSRFWGIHRPTIEKGTGEATYDLQCLNQLMITHQAG